MTTFIEISIILVIAFLVSSFLKVFKQPLIIAYIVTGLIVGPYVLGVLNSPETLRTYSEFGVALLLFIVGLHLSPKVMRDIGSISLLAGAGQVVITAILGILISIALHFSLVESIYLGIAMTFSSTIVVLKLLSDKGDLEKLYGKIAISFLIIQDIVASVVLIAIPIISPEMSVVDVAVSFVPRIVGLIVFLLAAHYVLLPRLSRFFAKSQEHLFLFAIAWGMGLASLFSALGFSLEIGALIAGVMLSLLPYNYEISSKMKPLRDFFLVLFFILFGSQVAVSEFSEVLVPSIIFSLFVLIGNPLIIIVLMGVSGHQKKTSFMSGLALAQVSEFSLILGALGLSVGHVSKSVLTVITITALITITISSYFIIYLEKIYILFEPFLSIFQRKNSMPDLKKSQKFNAILFGYNRIGFSFLEVFEKEKISFLVVDYDPNVIRQLSLDAIPCQYGDAEDADLLEELSLKTTKLFISTIPDFETNMFLIDKILRQNKKAIIMVVSHQMQDAMDLYKRGATYVIMPHLLGGEYAAKLVKKHKFSHPRFEDEKEKHLKRLDKRMFLGHDEG